MAGKIRAEVKAGHFKRQAVRCHHAQRSGQYSHVRQDALSILDQARQAITGEVLDQLCVWHIRVVQRTRLQGPSVLKPSSFKGRLPLGSVI